MKLRPIEILAEAPKDKDVVLVIKDSFGNRLEKCTISAIWKHIIEYSTCWGCYENCGNHESYNEELKGWLYEDELSEYLQALGIEEVEG